MLGSAPTPSPRLAVAAMTRQPSDPPAPADPPEDGVEAQLRELGLPTEFTILLNRAAGGDQAAEDEVFRCSYERLRRIAGNLARQMPIGSDLQATALVSEAFLRLHRAGVQAENRRHFLGLAAKSMRSILVDDFRARTRRKRAPADGRAVQSYDDEWMAQSARALDPIDLDDALRALQDRSPDLVEIIHLRFFLSMTVPEVAELLGVSVSMVERRFRDARDWLREQML